MDGTLLCTLAWTVQSAVIWSSCRSGGRISCRPGCRRGLNISGPTPTAQSTRLHMTGTWCKNRLQMFRTFTDMNSSSTEEEKNKKCLRWHIYLWDHHGYVSGCFSQTAPLCTLPAVTQGLCSINRYAHLSLTVSQCCSDQLPAGPLSYDLMPGKQRLTDYKRGEKRDGPLYCEWVDHSLNPTLCLRSSVCFRENAGDKLS